MAEFKNPAGSFYVDSDDFVLERRKTASGMRDVMALKDSGEDSGYVTPEMFGAKGDGIADDTVYLQEAADYASKNKKTLLLRQEYSISKEISIEKDVLLLHDAVVKVTNNSHAFCLVSDYATIRGTGTIKATTNEYNNSLVKIGGGVRYCRVESVNVFGTNTDKENGIGIEIIADKSFTFFHTIDNVKIRTLGTGISLNALNNWITCCTINANIAYCKFGVKVDGTHGHTNAQHIINIIGQTGNFPADGVDISILGDKCRLIDANSELSDTGNPEQNQTSIYAEGSNHVLSNMGNIGLTIKSYNTVIKNQIRTGECLSNLNSCLANIEQKATVTYAPIGGSSVNLKNLFASPKKGFGDILSYKTVSDSDGAKVKIDFNEPPLKSFIRPECFRVITTQKDAPKIMKITLTETGGNSVSGVFYGEELSSKQVIYIKRFASTFVGAILKTIEIEFIGALAGAGNTVEILDFQMYSPFWFIKPSQTV